MVQLQIHLHQGLLHVPNVRSRVLDEALTQSQVGAQLDNRLAWAEAAAQQPVLVQLQSRLLSDYVPAMHTTAEIHDELVGEATALGLSDYLANGFLPPTVVYDNSLDLISVLARFTFEVVRNTLVV
jgi:hypothetical protein